MALKRKFGYQKIYIAIRRYDTMRGKRIKDWTLIDEYETESSKVENFFLKGVRVAIYHPKEGDKIE